MGECVREGDGNRKSQILPIFTGSSPSWGKSRWGGGPAGMSGPAGDRVRLWARCQLLALPVSEAFTSVNQDQG